QVVAGEHVEFAAGQHLGPGAEPVAVKAGRVADADHAGAPAAPSPAGPPASWPVGPAAPSPAGPVAPSPTGWPAAGDRPDPGGPAKAWATSSQVSATEPVVRRARSLRCRRCVTNKQKSRAGPSTRSA